VRRCAVKGIDWYWPGFIRIERQILLGKIACRYVYQAATKDTGTLNEALKLKLTSPAFQAGE
jgi:hypothetical protein